MSISENKLCSLLLYKLRGSFLAGYSIKCVLSILSVIFGKQKLSFYQKSFDFFFFFFTKKKKKSYIYKNIVRQIFLTLDHLRLASVLGAFSFTYNYLIHRVFMFQIISQKTKSESNSNNNNNNNNKLKNAQWYIISSCIASLWFL